MESIDSSWNDNEHRDRRRVRWRERFDCFNVSHGKMWENRYDLNEERMWNLEEKRKYIMRMEETARLWKEIEMDSIRDEIVSRWSKYYEVGQHEVKSEEHEVIYDSCMGSMDESLKGDVEKR